MPNGWTELGRLVREERARRGRTQGQFARDIDMSARTLGSIERGTSNSFDENILARIDLAFLWDAGSAAALGTNGREPTRRDDIEFTTIVRAWPTLPDTLRKALAAAAKAGG